MATSGSTDFTMTRDEIITDALLLLGAIGIGDTPATNDVTVCARELNRMVKSWEAQGLHLWTQTEMTLALVEDQVTYTLSPTPLYISNVRLRNSSNVDRPVYIDSRTQYNQIPNKTTSGKINRVFYDKQLDSGTLYVWPAPDDDTDTLQITYSRKIEDFDASGNNADIPQEWLDCLVYNLAVRLAPIYGRSLQNKKLSSEIVTTAQQLMLDMQLWDTESSKVRIVPAAQYND